MARNDIVFTRGQGGLGRPLPEKDHISGIVFYYPTGWTYPSGWTADGAEKVYSLEQAEDLGIDNLYADETAASGGEIDVTGAGTAGETVTATMDGVTLGSYVLQTGDAIADIGTGLRQAINTLKSVHGYTAAGAVASTIELTPPTGKGSTINASGLAFATTGTTAATVTQFGSGVNSLHIVWWYHVSEYFRMQPKGELWIGVYEERTSDFQDVALMTKAAGGEIRRVGVYDIHESLTAGHVTLLQTLVLAEQALHRPLNILLAMDVGVALTALPDLTTLTANRVSVIIGEDGAGFGKELADANSFDITNLGACLGTRSLANIHECIAWPLRFNISNGIENETPAFCTGELFKNVNNNLIDAIDAKGYIFAVKHADDFTGTYWNDSYTATVTTDDYRFIEGGETLDKAVRNTRAAMLPNLASPVYIDSATGKLSEDTIAFFKNEADTPLENMVNAGELSGAQAIIDPDQDVLSTSELIITLELVPVGAARTISINIGFKLKLS